MANDLFLRAIEKTWSAEPSGGKLMLDLSCGDAATTKLLAGLGYKVIATDYGPPPPMGPQIHRLSGVDLNQFLPFRDSSADAINLVEVIEHIENQPQLIREFARVLKPGGRSADYYTEYFEYSVPPAFSLYRFSARACPTSTLQCETRHGP